MQQQNETEKEKEWKWPLGIFLFYMTFVVATLAFVLFTFTQKTDLVVEKYYEATITYQDHIDKASRALNLEQPLKVEASGRNVSVVFPGNMAADELSGTIVLYRPSGSGMDMKLPVQPDASGIQALSFDDKAGGLWKVKVEWRHQELDYFAESSVFIQ